MAVVLVLVLVLVFVFVFVVAVVEGKSSGNPQLPLAGWKVIGTIKVDRKLVETGRRS